MSKSRDLEELRRKAEARLRGQALADRELTVEASRTLVHELRTHQIELEMQNEELRRTQQELFASRDRYADLYDFAPVGYATLCENGLIVEANLVLADMVCVERRVLIGRRFSAFVSADDQDAYYLHCKAIRVRGTRSACRVRLLRRDADPLWVELDSIRVEADPKNLRTIVRDISERKRVEDALSDSEQRLKAAVDSTADSLVLLDRDHRVQMANWLCFGGNCEDAIGRRFHELVPTRDQQRVEDLLDRVVHQAQREEWDSSHLSIEGSMVHFSSVATPVIVSGQVTGSVVSSRDVTARKLLAKEKELREEQLQRAQRMEAIGRLAGGVAHDYNNLLTIIKGNAEFVLADPSIGETSRNSVLDVATAANRAALLTGQLLAYCRKQVLRPKLINLNHFVENLRPVLTRLVKEDIVLRTLPQEGLGWVRVDPSQIEQVVSNLVLNACDAMPEGGELTIETVDVELDAASCGPTDPGPGAYVMLAVRDTGSGMCAEVRERVFEPFFTTKRFGSGTGLGLATTIGIVEQHGGTVQVDSELARGSTFKILLPRVSEPVDKEPPSQVVVCASKPQMVLVVEDEPSVRNLAIRIVESLGYAVLFAGSGAEALTLAESYEGKIDLMISDVIMPGMDGGELARRITVLRPGIKVLFTSGFPRDVIAQQGVLDEGVHFVDKPYSLESIAAGIREAFG